MLGFYTHLQPQLFFNMRKLALTLLFLISGFGSITFAQLQSTVYTVPPLTPSSGSGGVTFEVESTKPIRITGLFCVFSTNATIANVWIRTGGVQHSPGQLHISPANGWTQVVAGAIITGADNSTLRPINFGTSVISVEANTRIGFYIEGNTRFHSGTTSVPAFLTDGILSVIINDSASYGGAPPVPASNPRRFTGGVTYMQQATGAVNDAGAFAISTPSPPVTPGVHAVTTTIRNYGASQIDSVQVNWSVNGVVQMPVTHITLVDTIGGAGVNLANVALGYFNFPQGNNTIRVWTSLPNNQQDNSNTNDTVTVDIFFGSPLSGTFTIGGTTADFASFNDALTRLYQVGVAGPVIFEVNPGTYTEQLSFTNDPIGVSQINSVTFRSANGDSTSVTLQYAALSTADNWVVRFDNSSNIIFKQMTIMATATAIGRVFVMLTNTKRITISNCIIKTDPTSTTEVFSGIHGPSGHTGVDNLIVIQNIFIGGYYSIFWDGNSASRKSNILVENNIMTDFYYSGISCRYSDSVSIRYNTLSNRVTSGTTWCISVSYNKGVCEITGNKVNLQGSGSGGQYGIVSSYKDVVDTIPLLIANNFVTQTGLAQICYTFRLDYTNYVYLYNNSARISNCSGSSRILSITNGSAIKIINNSLANFAGGYAIYSSSLTNITTSNYNNLYTNGGNLGYRGTNHINLLAWKTATLMDGNSISVDPEYTSNADLHTLSAGMWQAGIPLAEVPLDIDKEQRNTMMPCIGADEYLRYSNDAGVLQMTEPLNACSGAVTAIKVKIKNFGIQALNGVVVNWTMNGVLQNPLTLTSTLAPGAVQEITVGTYIFVDGIFYDMVFYTTDPGSVADQNPVNDTLKISGFQTSMSGIFSVGISPTDDFSTMADAVAKLKSSGVCGPVTINVAPNSGPFSGGINFEGIAGTSAVNTITFNGNGNIINETSLHYILRFSNNSYITIDSFQLVVNNPANERFGILIRNGSSHLTFSNNVINMGTVLITNASAGIASTGTDTIATSSGDNGRYLTITNNTIIGGFYGITLRGTASSYLNNYGHVVSNNTVSDFYQYGIYIVNADSSIIIHNNINRANRVTLTTFYGIYANTSRNIKYTGNQIHSSGIGSYSAYPVCINTSANSVGSETELINNAVYNIGTSGEIYGLYFLGTNSNINLFHNTVHIVSSGTQVKRAVFFSSAPSNNKLYNNILSVTGTGTGAKHCIYVSTTAVTMVSNHNDFFISAPGSNYIGYWGANRTTLTDWQTATSQDANSLDVNPNFPANDDFTTNVYSLWQSGSPIPGITHDIFGKPRNLLNPCRGAVEYSLFANEIGVVKMTEPIGACAGLLNIKVVVKNNGIATINSVIFNWSVNGVAQIPLPLTGLAILPGASQELTVGSFTFLQNVPYDLMVSTSMPNGMTDNDTTNDTLFVDGFMTGLLGTLTVGSAPSNNFNSLQEVVKALNLYGVCGPVVIDVDPNSGPYAGGIEIGAISGVTAINTVTFNGYGSTINESAATYILAFNGTFWVTVNEFNIINSNSANDKFGITVTGGSQHLKFTNNYIDMGITSASPYTAGIAVSNSINPILSVGNNGQYISILNNEIVGGYYGIVLMGQTSYLNCFGNIVAGNIIRDFCIYGIYLRHCDSTQISGNNICRAIRTGLSTFYGISATTCRNMKLIGNKIHSSGIGYYSCYPISVSESVNSSGYETEIINNAIFNLPTTGILYPLYLQGLRNYIRILHNTIHATADSVNSIYGVYFSGAPDNHSFKNNILCIGGTGSGSKYCIYSSATSATFTSDNNVFYMGATGGATNYTGFWHVNHCTNLQEWQTLSLQDLNSSNLNPLLDSITTGDFTPKFAGIDNMGTPSGVLTDINNTPRSLIVPDVGAIEFVSADIELNGGSFTGGQCINPNDSVFIIITNVIGETINLATNPLVIYWNVTGPVNSNGAIVLYSGNLPQSASMTVGGSGVNMSLPGSYTLSAFLGANPMNLYFGNDTIHNMATKQIFNPFYVEPKTVVVNNPTQTVSISAKSMFFTGGAFFITEQCHHKVSTGAPTGGWTAFPYLTAGDYIEITGVPNSDLWGYTLQQWSTVLDGTYTFPQGTILSPQGTAIIAVGQMGSSVPDPANYYYHGNGANTTDYSSAQAVGRILLDPLNNIVDAVGYGNYIFPGAAEVPVSAWSSPVTQSDSAASGFRLTAPDNNTGSCWALVDTNIIQNPNNLNSGLSTPLPGNLTGFTWSHNGVVFATNVNDTTVGPWTTSGIYHYVASYATPCGALSDTVAVVVGYLTSIPDTTICAGDSALLQVWFPGTGPWTLVVSDGAGIDTISGILSSPYSTYVSPTSTTVYSLLSFKEGNGQYVPSYLSCTVTVLPLPIVSLASFAPVCIYDTPLTLTGGLPLGGTYSGTGIVGGVFDPGTAGFGTHTITYSFINSAGCSGSEVKQILVGAVPAFTLTADHAICEGDSTTLTVSPSGILNAIYSWSNGAITPLITVSPVVSTTYIVTVTDTLPNCFGVDSVVVIVNPASVAAISGAQDTICVYHTITLDAGAGFASYSWSTGATTQTIMVDGAAIGHGNTMSYTVTVTNSFGCSAAATVKITADDCIGLSDPDTAINIRLWPNPNNGNFFIGVNGISGETKLIISNVTGKILCIETLHQDGETVKELNFSNKAPGIYTVRLQSESQVVIKQFVIR